MEEIIYDNGSGIITVDGEYVGTVNTEEIEGKIPTNDGSEIVPRSTRGSWVYYNTTWGNVGTDIGDTITIAGLIIAACGVTPGVAASVAGVVIRRKLDWISYTTQHYYYSPVTTSRPKTKQVTVFKDPDGKVIK